MTDCNALFQCIALPKGVEQQRNLRVTLTLAPSPTIDEAFNLPERLLQVQRIDLQFASDPPSSTQGPVILGTTALSPEHRKVLDPGLWRTLIQGVATASVERAGTVEPRVAQPPPPVAALRTAQIARTIGALHMHAARLATADEDRFAAMNLQVPDINPVARGIRMSDLRRPMRGNRPFAMRLQAGDSEPLATALQHVDQLFSRPGEPIDNLAGSLSELDTSHPSDAVWLRLLSAYRVPPSASPREVLSAHGLRVSQETVAWLRERVAGQPRSVQRGFGDVVLDYLLFSAPHVLGHAEHRAALERQRQSDDQSVSNRLAAMAGEFAIHPMLGLAVDLVFPVSLPVDDLRRLLAQPRPRLRVDLRLGSDVCQPWTLITPDAWPVPRSQTTVFQPTSDGWCQVPGATLSNVELRRTVTKWTSSLLEGRNRADKAARGRSAVSQEVDAANSQTGPLVMHINGLGHEAVQTANTGMPPGSTDPDLLNLEDLVIGVRPVLQVTDHRGTRFQRALLNREIDYPNVSAERRAIARMLEGPLTSREEGHVEVVRLTLPADGTQPVGTEQAFEWSGWNPAVPFPGEPERTSSGRLPKTVRAGDDDNLPYRYGTHIRAACRWVLRDGSSRIPASMARTIVDAPWVSASDAGESDGDGFILKRYEPLRPPLALMRDDPPDTPLLDAETANKVMLASLLGGPVVRRSSVRYIFPGAIRDLLDLDRHGVFDHGLPPTATAFPDVARAPTSEEAIFPHIERSDGLRVPVFRRQWPTERIAKNKLYHPDPLTTGLRMMLVRKDSHGALFQVHDDNMRPLVVDVPLYPGRSWPEACAVELSFHASRRDMQRAALRCEQTSHRMQRVRIDVPTGERFSVFVLPTGDRDELDRKHALAAMPDTAGAIANILTIDVQHVTQRPQPPHLQQVVAGLRPPNDRTTNVHVEAHVDAGSTSLVDLHAGWTDPVDDPLRGLPRDDSASSRVMSSMVVATLAKLIEPAGDNAMSDAALNRLVRPPLLLQTTVPHELPDTRHRRVAYRLSAAGSALLAQHGLSDNKESVASNSDPVWISIPASSPPLAPRVRELQLAFHFDRTSRLVESTSARTCAISILLERGWWSSGPGELLAVLVAPMPGPNQTQTSQSVWAADPIRTSRRPFGPELRPDDFAPTPQRRRVAGTETSLVLFEPMFDSPSNAWRVDVELQMADFQVQPFIQLVLARFQPNAIEGSSLSPPVVADFFQLPSNRRATITFDPQTNTMHIAVAGAVDEPCVGEDWAAACRNGGRGRMLAIIQRTERAGPGASVWIDTPFSTALTPDPRAPEQLQTGQIKVPPRELLGSVRVALFEQSCFVDDEKELLACGPLHYLDVIPMVLFEPPSPG